MDQLDGYFCGNLTRFDLPLDLAGTEFQLKVWRALCRIPYGETRAYGQIARALGQPGAARAVGLANNHNPVPIIVPCHRVIGADGSLTGYGGGLPRKRKLLDLEARFAHPVGRTGSLLHGILSPDVRRPRAARPGRSSSNAPPSRQPAAPKWS